MELKIFRDALPAAGTNCTLKAELPLETEILISDYLPPVFKLVKCFVRPVVLQKRLQPGKLQLEGYLRCVVYYQGEDGAGLCQTEQKLPFTMLLDLPEFVFTAWAVQVEGQTEYLNCRTVNPRRIEVRGAYGLVVSVHTQVKTDVITALSDGGVEQKLVTLSGVRRAAVLEKLVTVEGEIRFPTPPAAVLDLSGNASVGDLKLLNGKAVAKGVLVVSCAWRAEGDPALQSQSVNLNFNQVLDVDGLSEDCRCLCVAEPVGFTLTEGEGEEPSRLTATLMLRLRAWRPYQLQCVADAFSTKFETEQTPQTVQTESLACTLDETVTLTGSGPLPDAGAKILACFASFGPALLAYRENNWDLTSRVTVTAFGAPCRGPALCLRKRHTGGQPFRQGRRSHPTAERKHLCGLHRAGRAVDPGRPGDQPALLLCTGGGGAVCHRQAVPCLPGPDACGQRSCGGHHCHRCASEASGTGSRGLIHPVLYFIEEQFKAKV